MNYCYIDDKGLEQLKKNPKVIIDDSAKPMYKCTTEVTTVMFVLNNSKEPYTIVPQNELPITGTKAFRIFTDLIKKETGKELKEICGSLARRPETEQFIRRCVPTPVCWSIKSISKRQDIFEHCMKADIKSAFSYEGSKPLPNMNEYKVSYTKRIEPTEEYPFCFYSDGTLSIYNELDSADWERDGTFTVDYNERIFKRDLEYTKRKQKLFTTDIKTIACKAATESLKQVFEKLFEEKENGNKQAKSIMNFFVGYCWAKSKPIYAHIAAVIIARCNKRVIDYAKQLIDEGNMPLLICTDSVAWVNTNPTNIDLKERGNNKLGDFAIEYKDCMICIKSCKAYQIHYCGTTYTTWSGIKKNQSCKMKFGDILQVEDVFEQYEICKNW